MGEVAGPVPRLPEPGGERALFAPTCRATRLRELVLKRRQRALHAVVGHELEGDGREAPERSLPARVSRLDEDQEPVLLAPGEARWR